MKAVQEAEIIGQVSHPGDIARLYGRLAQIYDLFTDHEAAHHRAAVRVADIKSTDSVLEVACGTGRATIEIAKRLNKGQAFHAVDLTEAMIARAKRRLENYGLADRVDIQVGDARRLPFPDATFDVIYNGYMFDLLDSEEFPKVFSELKRVLKPGGRLVLVNMSKNTHRKTLYERLYEGSLLGFASGGCRPVILGAIVEKAGFENVTRQYRRNLSWFFLNWMTGTEIVIGWKQR